MAARAELAAARSSWMREREISKELLPDKKNGEQGTAVEVELLGRIQARMEQSMRDELRNQTLSKKSVSEGLEKMLEDELSTHLCPICMNLMVDGRENSGDGVDRVPLLLSPCGHSLCRSCVGKMVKKTSCPYCRAKIEHQAVNRPLAEMIARFGDGGGVAKRLREGTSLSRSTNLNSELCTPLEVSDLRNASSTTTESNSRYQLELNAFTARAAVLEQELCTVEREVEDSASDLFSLKEVERIAEENAQIFHSKWIVAKGELEEVRAQVNSMEKKVKEGERKKELLLRTLEPVKRDRDKCRIIIEARSNGEV